MNVRSLRPSDLAHASAVLHGAFARVAELRGYQPPWADEAAARSLLSAYSEVAGDQVLVAEEGGVVIGVGAMRVRGEIASIGPIASYVEGRGVGSAVLDGLLARADEVGAVATRLYVDAWNPPAFALYAGRGFGVVDVVAHLHRDPDPGPALGSSRGLEVRPLQERDLEELLRLDHKLTGHERERDLRSCVRLVARRRGSLVAYLGAVQADGHTLLGPAVAVDVSDLFTLLAHALGSEVPEFTGRPMRARLSTAAPAASLAALGLGFRVLELGVLMSRGAPPPTRPTQLYGLMPEVL